MKKIIIQFVKNSNDNSNKIIWKTNKNSFIFKNENKFFIKYKFTDIDFSF